MATTAEALHQTAAPLDAAAAAQAAFAAVADKPLLKIP